MLWIKTSLRIQLVGKSLVNFSRKFLTVGENQKEPALFLNCQLIFILARTKEKLEFILRFEKSSDISMN